MGPKLSVSVLVGILLLMAPFDELGRGYYFLRKESRLTTSPAGPLSAGRAGSGGGSASGGGVGTITGPGAALASLSLRNCRPNCTPGSKKAVSALKGICSGAGNFLKVSVTSK